MHHVLMADLVPPTDSWMARKGLLRADIRKGPQSGVPAMATPDGVIELTGRVSERLASVLEYYERTNSLHDCHFLSRAIAFGIFDPDRGMPRKNELDAHSLERVGTARMLDTDKERRGLDWRKLQLGSPSWEIIFDGRDESWRDCEMERVEKRLAELSKPTPENRYIESYAMEKGNSPECGDLCLLPDIPDGQHSMTYLGEADGRYRFLSRMGAGGNLSIHTLGQAFRYYSESLVEIWRPKNPSVSKNAAPLVIRKNDAGYWTEFGWM